MKSSIIWRSVIIVLVLLAWFLSIFPLQDRDFMVTFQRLAADNLSAYQEKQAEAEAKAEEIQERLAGLEEDSAQYKELQAEREELLTEAEENEEAVNQYQEILEQAQEKIAENENLAPYMAIREAAKGGATARRINLRQYIEVPTQPQASNTLVLSHVRREASGKLNWGLDLRGGTEFIIGFNEDEVPSGRQVEDVRDQIITILRNRVDRMGVVEPEIKPTGDASISLRMPSVSEGEKADIRRTIKDTAKLRFHLVHPDNNELVAQAQTNPEEFEIPRGYVYKEIENEVNGELVTQGIFIKERPEALEGEHVNRAAATFDEFGNYAVSLSFNSEGTRIFSEITSENVGQQLAIVLDGRVYSAPVIRDAITTGSAEISGNFSPEEARRLASVIESGNLPVSITIDSEFGTDPTLGRDSIESGVWAAIIGLSLVVAFMLVYYLTAGFIAILALAANLILVLGTLTLTGATLTLPGIAGIILTIGMAVDANVLIFERIREELRNGKTTGNAVKAGYSRAFLTIFDSNITTLLTALILYRFGTGPIRGFAVTLSIGIVASMFTALFMTRTIFDALLYTGSLKNLKMFSFFREPSLDFMRIRRITLIFSAILIVASIAAGVVRGRNALSIDFAGGTELSFQIVGAATSPDISEVRQVMEQNGYGNARIGYKFSAAQTGRLLEVVLPERSTDEAALSPTQVQDILNQALFDGAAAPAELEDEAAAPQFKLVQTNSVGGLVGAAFQRKAVWAAIFAAIAIIIYVSFRFEFAYGVAAVVALIHDVIIATGIYLMLGRQLSLPVVAALLTIMGYSINDTIVVFDRIREDLGLLKGRKYIDIINLSINQTLSRTILTSLTTLIVVGSLVLLGGGAINDFAIVMLIGIFVGTYSSVFIASSIIASWHKRARGSAVE